MNKYEMIYESICDLFNEGILTEEEAEELNYMAYENYINEDKSDILADIAYRLSFNKGSEYNLRGIKKRPLIKHDENNEIDMDDNDRYRLHNYDHPNNNLKMLNRSVDGKRCDDLRHNAFAKKEFEKYEKKASERAAKKYELEKKKSM